MLVVPTGDGTKGTVISLCLDKVLITFFAEKFSVPVEFCNVHALLRKSSCNSKELDLRILHVEEAL